MLEEVGHEPRLADPGRADQREQPAGPRLGRVGEIGAEPVALALAPDHRPLEVARTPGGGRIERQQPVGGDRVRLPFHRQRHRLGLDRVTDEARRLVAEQDLAGAGRLLEPRRHVDRVAGDERVPLAGDDLAGVDADPRLEPEPVHVVAQLDRGAHRAQRVVLGRHRDPEDGHHRVADELLHRAPVALEHAASRLVVAVHQGTQRLRIGALADRRRPGQVAEEHGDDLAHLTRRRGDGERCPTRRAEAEVVRALATALRRTSPRARVYDGSQPQAADYVSAGSRIAPDRRALRRSTAFVCSCETRDSVTPSTSPISRSVSSS